VTATLGVDLGGTGTRVVVLDAGGQVVRRASVPTAVGEPDQAVPALLATLADLARGHDVGAAGIGASGPITAGGIIDNQATLPAYTGVDLAAAVRQQTGWSCVIDNDAAAAAMGEYTYGAGRGSRACLTVTLGTGIGVAVIRDGQLFRAGDGTHPEAGHIAVRDSPVSCYCGLARCWEQAASRTCLEGLVGGSPATAAAAARAGDARAARSFERYGQQVAAGLGTLLTVFRPDRVVLGGSAAQYLDLFAAPLTTALDRQPPYEWLPPIVAAELGDLAGAIGAAVLARSAGRPAR
jgi:glucokinase